MKSVVHLRPLNRFLHQMYFKMEGLHVIRDVFRNRTGCAKSTSRTQSFFVHGIGSSSVSVGTGGLTSLLAFLLDSPQHQLFTKVLRTVVGCLRLKGVCCVIYLDDLLIMADTREKASERCIVTFCLLESLGFLVNYERSQVQPVQVLAFLGLVVDPVQRTLSLPSQKLVQIRSQA